MSVPVGTEPRFTALTIEPQLLWFLSVSLPDNLSPNWTTVICHLNGKMSWFIFAHQHIIIKKCHCTALTCLSLNDIWITTLHFSILTASVGQEHISRGTITPLSPTFPNCSPTYTKMLQDRQYT